MFRVKATRLHFSFQVLLEARETLPSPVVAADGTSVNMANAAKSGTEEQPHPSLAQWGSLLQADLELQQRRSA